MRECSRCLHPVAVRIVSVAVVEENDRPWRDSREGAADYLVYSGFVAVPHAERPAHGALAVMARDRRRPRTPETVRRAEISRRWRARASDRTDAEADVAPDIERALELKLPVEVPVIAKLVSLGRNPPHQLWPTLGVTPQHEKRRAHAFLGEGIQNQGRRVWVRSVVEGQRNDLPITLDPAQSRTEERAVAVKRAVDGAANHRYTKCCKSDHTPALPNTAV